MVKYWFPKSKLRVRFLLVLKSSKFIYIQEKRAYSLKVEHTAHNGKNVGSNPTILKE